MKWRGRRTSSNIEDRRGTGGGGGSGGSFGGGFRMGGGGRPGGGGARIGGLGAVVVLVIALFLGLDPAGFLGGDEGTPGGTTGGTTGGAPPAGDAEAEFVGVVLADTEEVWGALFRERGRSYEPPLLVLFEGATGTACGLGESASGPFYCPADRKAYLDLAFFRTLERQLGAGGDFARAYVIAHEVAHHVQAELGIMAETARLRARATPAESNRISVMVELQADCFAGVWAKQAERRFGALEPGDVEEALNAASRIGDDTLQRQAGGRVVPDSFTHGTSEQRVRWFRRGYDAGRMGVCDTFNAPSL